MNIRLNPGDIRSTKPHKAVDQPLLDKGSGIVLEGIDDFNNNKQRHKSFLSSYKKFNKGFIHISHAPINDSIGMDAQITSSVVNTRVWSALEGTAYASLIKRAVKRDIFYNR